MKEGLIKRIMNAPKKAIEEAKIRRVVRKMQSSCEDAIDAIEREADKARMEIMQMLSHEELLKLDSDKEFDMTRLRELRARVRTCKQNIEDIELTKHELFVEAPDDLDDLDDVESADDLGLDGK